MLKTIEFIQKNSNWREILSYAPYCLHINEDDNFALLKYNQIDSDFTLDIVKECRGLIIDKNTYEPVALSFVKFFNVQEPLADTIYWKESRVQEKVDGSKMLVWYNIYESKWQISTSSNLDAYKANVSDFGITFGQLFDRALETLKIDNFYEMLDKNFCYTFELVSPESRVVVPYKKTKIYFIGLRYVPTFIECNPDSAEHICKVVPRPKEFPLPNLKSCLTATEAMGYDQEGFVVVDKNWNRVKIKSPAYVAAHYLKNNGVNSRSRILSIIEKNEQAEFLGLFPEYKDMFDEIETKYVAIKQQMFDAIADVQYLRREWQSLENPRKTMAAWITDYHKEISGTLFKFLDTDLVKYFVETEWSKLSKDKKMSLLGYKEVEEPNGNN